MNFSPSNNYATAALSDQQKARPRLRTGEPAVPPQPTVAGDLFPARSKPLDSAGLPRYRADPGAPSRTLAVQAPAQGRFPRGSGRPGFIAPGLLFADWLGRCPRHCLHREWYRTLRLRNQSGETGTHERAYDQIGATRSHARASPVRSRGDENLMRETGRSACSRIPASGSRRRALAIAGAMLMARIQLQPQAERL